MYTDMYMFNVHVYINIYTHRELNQRTIQVARGAEPQNTSSTTTKNNKRDRERERERREGEFTTEQANRNVSLYNVTIISAVGKACQRASCFEGAIPSASRTSH